jgi:hypothetical protein
MILAYFLISDNIDTETSDNNIIISKLANHQLSEFQIYFNDALKSIFEYYNKTDPFTSISKLFKTSINNNNRSTDYATRSINASHEKLFSQTRSSSISTFEKNTKSSSTKNIHLLSSNSSGDFTN